MILFHSTTSMWVTVEVSNLVTFAFGDNFEILMSATKVSKLK